MSNSYNSYNTCDFLTGEFSNAVTKEERGLPLTGNISTFIKLDPEVCRNISTNLLIPPIVTNDENCFSNIIKKTPLLYCNQENKASELLPEYPNGIQNTVLSPDCNMNIGNSMSPTIYGETTAFINDADLLNDSCNNIGHELQGNGIGNMYGMRGLSQGKYAKVKLENGQNVPTLEIAKNKHHFYYSKPMPVTENSSMYQVGDWTDIEPNFLSNFNDNLGKYCEDNLGKYCED